MSFKKVFEVALGVVTSFAGFLEAGSIATSAQAGAEFGYQLVWPIALGTLCVIFLIEMSGLATFRRHERACLERVVAENEGAVIATAGGIVSNPETYGFLLRHTHTVWVSAQPDEHMSRVMKQGDFRPTGLMEKVSRYLELRDEPQSRNEIEKDVKGKGTYVRIAIDRLVKEGYAEAFDGPRGAQLVRLKRAFREAEEES